jgi:hypothetical protein
MKLILLIILIAFGSSASMSASRVDAQRAGALLLVRKEVFPGYVPGFRQKQSRNRQPEAGYPQFIKAVKRLRTGGILIAVGVFAAGFGLFTSSSGISTYVALLLLAAGGVAEIAGGIIAILGLIGYFMYRKYRSSRQAG